MQTNDDSNVVRFDIVRVIQNQLFMVEFFNLPLGNFSTATLPSMGRGDFFITASPEEQQQLLALFDEET